MTPDQIAAAVQSLQSQVVQLQTTMNYHKHTGNDFTKKLDVTAAVASYFMGDVISNAKGSIFPSGWSVTHLTTGVYQINHTLASTAYIPMATVRSSGYSIAAPNIGSSSFEIIVYVGSSSPVDSDFNFVVFT